MTWMNMADRDKACSIPLGAGMRFLLKAAAGLDGDGRLRRLKHARQSRRPHGALQFVASMALDLANPLARQGVTPAELVESRRNIVEPTREQDIALTWI
jgi:hypothetical protein